MVRLRRAVLHAARRVVGCRGAGDSEHGEAYARVSTTGGTSDGRFIAPTGAQVVELGVINATIHKVNEYVSVAEIDALSQIYGMVLELMLGEAMP